MTNKTKELVELLERVLVLIERIEISKIKTGDIHITFKQK